MAADWNQKERKLLEDIVFDQAGDHQMPYMHMALAYGLLAQEAGDPKLFLPVKERMVDRFRRGVRNVCLFNLRELFELLKANGMLRGSELSRPRRR